MVSAGVGAAAVVTAGMVCAVMIVVAAANIGVEIELTGQIGLHGCIGIALNTAVKFDSGVCQCHLSAAADTAADQNIGLQNRQYACQSTVTAAVGAYHLGVGDHAVLHIIYLEGRGVAEMLEDLSVFVSNCNSHS